MGLFSRVFGRKLRCRNCGHVQRRGAWEKRMDRTAKARGQAGFINLTAPPQCLSCGTTGLRDISKPVDYAEEGERELIRRSAEREKLLVLMYIWGNSGETKVIGDEIKMIGQDLADRGRQALMRKVCMSLDMPEYQNRVSAYFNGIGGWMH